MKVVINTANQKAFRAHLAGNVEDAAQFLTSAIQAKIGILGPPPSLPGEPPHVDTGELIKSYHYVTDTANLSAAVGSDVEHSIYMELGTDKVAARPHVLPTLLENADEIAAEMCKS